MRTSARFYLYVIAIVGLATYNGVRFYRARHVDVGTTTAYLAPTAPRGTSPIWDAFDKAATVRDAPDAQFSPALTALSQAIDSANSVAVPPTTSPDDLAALNGCRTWLLFYRQTVLHPATKGAFSHDQTAQHVTACAANHADATH